MRRVSQRIAQIRTGPDRRRYAALLQRIGFVGAARRACDREALRKQHGRKGARGKAVAEGEEMFAHATFCDREVGVARSRDAGLSIEMNDDPDLEAAYGLDGPVASKKLYANWAETYDTTFAADMHYRAPAAVAACYARLSTAGPVLDLGAGTGLVGEELARRGAKDIHGTDISPEMLQQAAQKSVYARLFEGDLTARLPVEDGFYVGVVSAGTFTHGHVGPDALEEVLRCMAPKAWAVLSVNAAHWDALGFAHVLERLDPMLSDWRKDAFALYGADAQGEHAKDQGWLLQMLKA